MKYCKDKTVIVYLAMNTKQDKLYGRDPRSMLEKSLDSLYLNYNNDFKHNVIVFYDSRAPFTESDIINITNNRKEIKFQLIPDSLWCPPDCENLRNNPDPKKWKNPNLFSIGYRNMARWYGILIYKYLTDLGYEWYMRMDDDSFLHSKIEYDLFQFMCDNDYEYGFRAYSNDHISASKGLIEFCNSYCSINNVNPTFLNRHSKYNKLTSTKNHNITGYYNNFLISKLSFWMREDVQKFIKSFDNSGYQYIRRWGDLLAQTVAVQIFMERNKVYHFNDWCYEHTTIKRDSDSKTTILWGGIYPAIKDGEIHLDDYIQKHKDKHKVYNKNAFDIFHVQNCLNKTEVNLKYKQIPKVEEFKPLNNDSCYFLGSYDTLDEVYFAIEDYWVNCNDTIQRYTQFTYPLPFAFIWHNSLNNSWFHKRLYVINNKQLLDFNCENANVLFFKVIKSIIIK